MIGIMRCNLLRFLADIKARRTMRAPQPYPADLVRVDITQCLHESAPSCTIPSNDNDQRETYFAMQHMFEVRERIPWVQHSRHRHHPDLVLVLRVSARNGR
jgi:hypothetical protein